MRIELSRYEIQYLLSLLDPVQDQELADKLWGQMGSRTVADYYEKRPYLDKPKFTPAEGPAFPHEGRLYPVVLPDGWTAEEVAIIENQRRVTEEAQRAMAQVKPSRNPQDAAGAEFAQPEMPEFWQIQKVEVGETNSAGDPCILIDPAGYSVFRCGRGHGYVGNNPAVRGCTYCAATEGSGSTTVSDSDDSNW